MPLVILHRVHQGQEEHAEDKKHDEIITLGPVWTDSGRGGKNGRRRLRNRGPKNQVFEPEWSRAQIHFLLLLR